MFQLKFQHIQLKIQDRVVRITLSRPPLNVITIPMMKEILRALEECENQRDTVAIVFDAAQGSRGFSAGVSIEEHAEEIVFQMLENFHAIFRTIERIGKPAVALVDGMALGGGCELVATCDIVIASDRARFGQPEIKLGVFPPIAAVLLPSVIGPKKARELLLTGELMSAQEALHFGLVNYVLPSSELENKLQLILSRLRELSSVSLASTKHAIDAAMGLPFDEGLKQTEDIYLNELMRTDDAREGIKAFIEKRRPNWKHR